jgi:ribosomal protein S18 acetylase RimI-like enzyme
MALPSPVTSLFSTKFSWLYQNDKISFSIMDTASISASSSSLLAAMEENLHGHIAYLQRSTPGMVVRDEGDLFLVDSGLACDTFNKVARARLEESKADSRIKDVIRYFQAARRPFTWWGGPGSRPLNLESRLRAHGFEAGESELGMSLEFSQLPARLESRKGMIIRRAETRQEIADFAAVIAANWAPPDFHVIAFYERTTAALLEANCPMRLFVGYLDGEPVSASEVFFGAGVAGIYSVATRKEYRGRGLGSALTYAAAQEAKRMSIPRAVLQSSNDGKGVYVRLGFQRVGRFIEYTIAAAARGF